jgi:hypothetical protein
VSELFDAVDVGRRGELSRAELAAGLIDWKAFEVRSAGRGGSARGKGQRSIVN